MQFYGSQYFVMKYFLSNFFIYSEENAEEKSKSLRYIFLETESFDIQRDEEIMNLYKSN